MKRLTVVVTHASCAHTAESWTAAFGQALSHSGKYMNPQSRQPVIRMLMRGEDVWHEGVMFRGKVV